MHLLQILPTISAFSLTYGYILWRMLAGLQSLMHSPHLLPDHPSLNPTLLLLERPQLRWFPARGTRISPRFPAINYILSEGKTWQMRGWMTSMFLTFLRGHGLHEYHTPVTVVHIGASQFAPPNALSTHHGFLPIFMMRRQATKTSSSNSRLLQIPMHVIRITFTCIPIIT